MVNAPLLGQYHHIRCCTFKIFPNIRRLKPCIELRSYVFFAAQHAAYMGTVALGFCHCQVTSLWIEISPGIEINRIMDVALKLPLYAQECKLSNDFTVF